MTIAVSFWAGLLAYALFGAFIAKAWRINRRGWALAIAVSASLGWIIAALTAHHSIAVYGWLAVDGMNGVRIMAWIGLLYILTNPARLVAIKAPRTIASYLLMAAASLLLAKLGGLLAAYSQPGQGLGLLLSYAASVGLAVIGLVLIETLVAHANPDKRWASKHLLIGTGAILAFDIFYYSDLLLLRRLNEFSMTGQVWIAIFAVPLIAVGIARIREFKLTIPVTRDAVLQTSALIGCGVYLLAIALVTYSLQGLGWSWTPALQLVFVCGAALLLLVLVSSGQLRDHWRHLVTRSFFTFQHDYRKEWQRMLAIMNEAGPTSLHERLIRAAAGPFNCSAGAIFLQARHGGFHIHETWNWTEHGLPASLPAELTGALQDGAELKELGKNAAVGLNDSQAWLLLTLRGRGSRLAVIVLGKPRLRRRLTWEDRELLAMLGDQLGSYLVEEQLAVALDEARQFERLSKNFSFVAHDLKNIVTQLSLLLQQASRHGDNPEFLADTWLTVRDAVEKMKAMLLRLNTAEPANGQSGGTMQVLQLAPALDDVVLRKQHSQFRLTHQNPERAIAISVDPAAFATVIEQLIDNAFEAGGNVGITVKSEPAATASANLPPPGTVSIIIADDGHGMSASFLKERLFQPFISTKRDGFGVGMFQAREWIESWQGRMEVESTPQQGTTIIIRLPIVLSGDASNVRDMTGQSGPVDTALAKDGEKTRF